MQADKSLYPMILKRKTTPEKEQGSCSQVMAEAPDFMKSTNRKIHQIQLTPRNTRALWEDHAGRLPKEAATPPRKGHREGFPKDSRQINKTLASQK